MPPPPGRGIMSGSPLSLFPDGLSWKNSWFLDDFDGFLTIVGTSSGPCEPPEDSFMDDFRSLLFRRLAALVLLWYLSRRMRMTTNATNISVSTTPTKMPNTGVNSSGTGLSAKRGKTKWRQNYWMLLSCRAKCGENPIQRTRNSV